MNGGNAARPRIAELVVVEGLHDKQAVQRAVDADVWVLGGERIPRHVIQELRRAAAVRGIIVLTDPDGPGERIRRRLDGLIPGCRHAFVPRSRAVSARGVGIEHADPAVIRAALVRAGSRPEADAAAPRFTLADLAAAGLVAGPHAAARRRAVGEWLGIGYGNAKAFVHKLNALGVGREEWDAAVRRALAEDGP
ncbi:ribonuclease M5 [Alicyclobacillus cellulosilyticus]|uniref:Ribonuclease M5 n=1 Tax=Alicyclobacillus cellulosilyticus TaxID=1003997 RepID=A0A917NQ33_9BACL|nr:DUF4093 domain-containing protein [Alicyclobacillus cellulosilyticus]GGJ14277.1 ribonuclease M5 [Alicyclobacillus cellulosilyticus]